MFFKLIKVHLLVSELYIYQNVRWNNKKLLTKCFTNTRFFGENIFSDNLTVRKSTKLSNGNAPADTRLLTSIPVSNRCLPAKKKKKYVERNYVSSHIHQNYLCRRHIQNMKSL